MQNLIVRTAFKVLLLSALLATPEFLGAQGSSAEVHWQKGNDYLTAQQWEQALKEYDQALKLDPNHVKSYIGRGVAYLSTKQYDQALADFNRALKLDPAGPEAYGAYLNRGLAYRDKGQFDQALADFNKSLELNPDNTLALYYKASALDLGGRSAEALVALKLFVQQCPENEHTRPMIDNAQKRIRLLAGPGKSKGR